jgi:MFS family permease
VSLIIVGSVAAFLAGWLQGRFGSRGFKAQVKVMGLALAGCYAISLVTGGIIAMIAAFLLVRAGDTAQTHSFRAVLPRRKPKPRHDPSPGPRRLDRDRERIFRV